MKIKRLLPAGLLSCTAALSLSLTLPPAARAQSPAVPAAGTSANYAAAAKHLELGGLFYGFMDVEGDLAKLGKIGDRVLDIARKQGAEVPKELKATNILDALGLTSVKALGGSSRALGEGMYHNRGIIFAPGAPVGLFKLFGGKAAPLASPTLAAAGSDIVGETDLTLSALLEISEAIVKSIGDERLMQQYKGSLGFPVPGLPMTVGELISRLDTKIIVFGQLEDGKKITIPNSKDKIPAFKAVLSFDNIDFLFETITGFAEQSGGQVKVEKGDGFELIRPAQPLPGDLSFFEPVLYHDIKSKRILLASHLDYLRGALAGAKPLSGDPAYAKATEGLPKEANSFSYVTPKVAVAMMELMKAAMRDAPATAGDSSKEMMEEMMSIIREFSPVPSSPVAAVRANVPDGMLFLSHEPSSLKVAVLTAPLIPVAIVSSTAFAAYGKMMPAVRAEAAKKEQAAKEPEPAEEPENTPAPSTGGASGKAIRNNLQQIAYSAQTYFLDNPKAKEVTYEKLISTELLFKLDPVAGESYKGLTVKRAGGSLAVKSKSGDSVSLTYPPVTD